MLEFLQRFFSRQEETSSKTAKERLRLVLVHDRSSVSPQILDDMRVDLIKVISRYLDIDEAAVEVSLSKEDESVALVASIPVLRVKRTYS